VTHAFGLLIQHPSKFPQPRQVSVDILTALDLVLLVEEGRHALVRAGELAHDVRSCQLAIVEGRCTSMSLHRELDRVVVREIQPAELIAGKRAQAFEACGVLLLGLMRALHRIFGQLRLRPSVLTLVESE